MGRTPQLLKFFKYYVWIYDEFAHFFLNFWYTDPEFGFEIPNFQFEDPDSKLSISYPEHCYKHKPNSHNKLSVRITETLLKYWENSESLTNEHSRLPKYIPLEEQSQRTQVQASRGSKYTQVTK